MSDADPVSALDAHLGFWLRMVSNAVSHSFARALEGEGVTVAEWVFLRTLYGAEPTPPSRVAETLGMTRGAITKLADRLIDKGLAARRADPEDGRAQLLSLTLRGRKLVPRLAALADANDGAFFTSLNPSERAHLERLLKKIVTSRGITEIPAS
jgi:DNA-binding MarR family transcriptional regulator